MAKKIQGPKGTRDFYPEEMRRHRHLEDIWRRVSLRAGFEEIDGPTFESLELYVQKSGEEIADQLYTFEDKGGRQHALRPEFTPTLARMVVARQATLPRPVKWFSIQRFFRYERAQRGRLREFFQWNCDILGAAGAAADAECLAVAADALREFGLKADHVEIRVSNRRLLAALLKRLGLADETIPKVYLALDKRGKVPDEVVEAMLAELDVSAEQRAGIDHIFGLSRLEDISSEFTSDPAVAEALGDLSEVFRLAHGYGIGDLLRFDIGIVRGLAYYTGIVWEVFDKGATLRSLFGGGRYDNLIATMGGQPMPACGFGAGDVTIGLLLDDLNLWPAATPRTDFYVVSADDSAAPQAFAAAGALRGAGRSAQYALNASSMSKQMKSAADSGARWAVIVGADDCPAGLVRVRDMKDGSQRDISIKDAARL